MKYQADNYFKVYFNRRAQWLDVYLWDVHPNTFYGWAETRWGYFLATWENPYAGLFGELHFVKSRARVDTVVHEILHAWMEWLRATQGTGNVMVINTRQEEWSVRKADELVRSFYREYNKL